MTHTAARIVALATHAREVRSEDREQFAIDSLGMAAASTGILIRTCHRVELYALEQGSAPGTPTGDGSLPALPPGGRRLEGDEAVRHLLCVAAGLDSVAVGEDQILHQLRESLAARRVAAASGNGGAGPDDVRARAGRAQAEAFGERRAAASVPLAPELERLFQVALRVGRETRSWREVPPRSLADVALDRVELDRVAAGKVAPDDPADGALRILVVGAGRMGRLVARAAHRRGMDVVVVNRTTDRAAALALEIGGEVVASPRSVGWEGIGAVVLAISGPWDLDRSSAARLARARCPVVDLSSPPAVTPNLRARLGHRFTSIDDLATAPQAALRDRMQQRFERLSAEACAEFDQWLRARSSVPTIRKLADRAEAHRSREIERLLDRIPDLDQHQLDLVDQMSRRLVATILHEPLATLHDDTSGELERAARALFAL